MRITKIIYQRLCTLYPRFETGAWVYSGMAVTTTLRIRGMKCRGKRKRQREKLFQASECGVARAKRSEQEKKKRWVGIKRQVLKEQVQSVCEQLWKRKLLMPRNKATSKNR